MGASLSSRGKSSFSLDEIRVLHVEDDADFRYLISTFLKRENDLLAIDSVSSADAGLEFIDDNPVDCIVSDYDMPGTDGLEFLNEVRYRHSDLPFILFTGKGSEEIASRAISSGVTDYVQKGGTEKYALLANRIEAAVEKYRTEEQLDALRRRYELVGKVATDAFYEKDLTTGKVLRSQGYTTNFGYPAGEIGDDDDWWKDRVHPEDRPRVFDVLPDTIDEGDREYRAEYRFRMDDGTYGYVADRGTVVYDEGVPTRAVGTLTDITDRKERQFELECAAKRLEIALDAADIGIWEWDWETNELFWDEQVKRLCGVADGAFGGTYREFIDRVHPDDVDAVETAIEAAVKREDRYDATFRILPDEGDERWVEAMGQTVVDSDETPTRMIGTVKEITERRRSEVTIPEPREER